MLKPKVGAFDVDLSPIHRNEVLMNPQRYAYPACAITVRASAMLRLADYPCLLTSEPVTATLMTNIIALHKEIPAAPGPDLQGLRISNAHGFPALLLPVERGGLN